MTANKYVFVPSWLLTIGTVVAFLCSLVVAGHGALPMALLLVLGWENWFFSTLLAWVGDY